MSPSDLVAINDIFSLKWRYYGPKREICTIGGELYFVYYHIISYQRIKVYRVETMDKGRFHWNNDVSVKFNNSKYCGAIVYDVNPLVGVIRC